MAELGRDPEAIKASVASYRSHFTRQKNVVKAVSDSLHDRPSPMLRTELEKAYKALYETVEKLIERFLVLTELEPTVKDWGDYISHYMDQRTIICRDVNVLLSDTANPSAPNPSHGPVVVQGGAAAGPKGPRIIEALKPKALSQDATPAELRAWKTKFRDYYTSSEMEKFPFHVQRGFFTSCLDKHLTARLSQQFSNDTEIFSSAANRDACMVFLDEDFERRYPLFARRLEFFQHNQCTGQTFSDYVAELQTLGEEADLHSLKVDELLVFRVIAGVTDEKLRDRFFKLTEPTMKDIIKEGTAHEAAKNIMKVLKGKGHASAAAVESSSRSYPRTKRNKFKQNRDRSASRADSRHASRPNEKFKGLCLKCGSSDHTDRSKCRKDVYCHNCKTKSHDTSVCYSKGQRSHGPSRGSSPTRQRTSAVTNQVRSTKSKPTPLILVKFRTLGRAVVTQEFEVKAMPDTGATRSIIAERVLKEHDIPFNRHDKEKLFVADGGEMKCTGDVQLFASAGGQEVVIDAVVSPDVKDECLVSWHDLIELGILPKSFPQASVLERADVAQVFKEDGLEAILQDYPDVISDKLGERVMKGPPMRIHLRDDIPFKPQRVLTARQTPLHLQEEAEKELDKLIKNGIVEPVREPTDCISPSHFVLKDDGKSVRLVTDFKINPFVKRPVHPFPSSQDIIQSLSPHAKWFAKLDAVQGYFQIPLDEESSKLTTFLLPTGRYKYTRAPMGMNASSDEFCARMDQALHGIKDIKKLVDDILVSADTELGLYVKIREVLDQCREHCITISKKKFKIGQEVKFAGHIVSATGVKPDPEKTRAIAEFPHPQDLTDLRSFLGLANQLGSFLPDLAHATSNMRKLMKKNVSFQWLDDHEEDFKKARSILTSDLMIKPFDQTLSTELLTDASRLHGLGFVLIQREPGHEGCRLILCGSRSLIDAETRYATIELELLAITWAVEKCRYYLLGIEHFTILTDHRPLEGLFNKNLVDIDNGRLLKFRERLLPYTFTVMWTPGKTHQIADALSRNPVFSPTEEEEETVTINVCCRTTREDPAMSLLFDNIDSRYQSIVDALGSCQSLKKLPDTHPAKPFSNVWSELSLLDGNKKTLLLLGTRIVVPTGARKEILKRLHLSHSGLVKTRKQAQQLYYWPGINRDIADMVASCDACNENKTSLPKEPLSGRKVAQAMSEVGMDLFQLGKAHYLVMVDRFSGFPVVKLLKSLSTSAVTTALKQWFNLFGYPEVIRSDGGPQFRTEFVNFCHDHYITHEKSSPYYPQSNGLAEAAVKSTKTLLIKCKENGDNYEDALAAWRNTPRADGFSPSEMFFGRRLRSALPTLSPTPIDVEEAAVARQRTQESVKARFDQSAHPLSSLARGDRVMVQHPVTKKWYVHATVLDSRSSGRSYIVETDDGSKFPRNRRFLRPVDGRKSSSGTRKTEPSSQLKPILRRSPRLHAPESSQGRRVTFELPRSGRRRAR